MTEAAIIAPALNDIRAASKLIAPHIVRSPCCVLILMMSRVKSTKTGKLQAIGVFKVRSMGNTLLSADKNT